MQKTFDQFKKAFAGAEDQLDACLQLMTQLKIALLDFSSLPPATADGSATAQQELTLAREILEHGAMLSIKAMDIPSFERYVAQLKVYYTDCATHLPESQRQFPILGLNLLRLLAQNRIAEFHTELEQIPMALQQSNVYIKFPAQVASRTHRQSPLTPLSQRSARPTDRPPAPMPQLEQHIMEGSYNKVLSAKQDGQYAKEGMFFMDMLVDTVRDEIAELQRCHEAPDAAALCNSVLSFKKRLVTAVAEKHRVHVEALRQIRERDAALAKGARVGGPEEGRRRAEEQVPHGRDEVHGRGHGEPGRGRVTVL